MNFAAVVMTHIGGLGLGCAESYQHWVDTDLGLTVPDEQLSHEQDLAHVIGHVILVVLCGNQCAALCDGMPTDNEFLHGVWTTFDFTWI